MTVFSVVTATYNSEKTLEDTLRSVSAQKRVEIEHIIIDGGSSDRTMDIIERYRSRIAHVVSEADKGIYDAMSKGMKLASGEYAGCLNSDDYFASENSISKIADVLERTGADCAFGSIVYVNDEGRPQRKMDGRWFKPERLGFAIMPPHPAFYARTRLMQDLGGFDPSYKIAGDFDLMLRLFKQPKFRFQRIDDLVTVMRMGGVSTKNVQATRTATAELYRALVANGYETSMSKVNSRYLLKIFERLAGAALALRGVKFLPNGESGGL